MCHDALRFSGDPGPFHHTGEFGPLSECLRVAPPAPRGVTEQPKERDPPEDDTSPVTSMSRDQRYRPSGNTASSQSRMTANVVPGNIAPRQLNRTRPRATDPCGGDERTVRHDHPTGYRVSR